MFKIPETSFIQELLARWRTDSAVSGTPSHAAARELESGTSGDVVRVSCGGTDLSTSSGEGKVALSWPFGTPDVKELKVSPAELITALSDAARLSQIALDAALPIQTPCSQCQCTWGVRHVWQSTLCRSCFHFHCTEPALSSDFSPVAVDVRLADSLLPPALEAGNFLFQKL